MTRLKIGELVSIKTANNKLGTVLSISSSVPYEGVYAKVLLDGIILEVHETVIIRLS